MPTDDKKSLLEPGTVAPDFTGNVFNGEPLTLSDLRGKRVWLAFFRYASCPLCNLRVRDLIERYDEFTSQGVQVVAVFQSPEASMAKHVGKQAPPFPLVMDPDQQLYRLYHVQTSTLGILKPRNIAGLGAALKHGLMPGLPNGAINRIPADFLLDEHGTIVDAYYGDAISDHIPFERAEAFARR